ncbi:MAG: hypothetical protein CFE25_02610 [Chitinophagaceae bacterium BSSC1]|nr:MAG: hypothetical protein CFE25_02610 [Chitinophagaceae bacterium BSSC1]
MKPICLFVNLLLITATKSHAQQLFPASKPQSADSLKYFSIRSIPQNLYTKNLAFFCRTELQLEKRTKVPFRFRLGSMDYVDALEGKKRQ